MSSTISAQTKWWLAFIIGPVTVIIIYAAGIGVCLWKHCTKNKQLPDEDVEKASSMFYLVAVGIVYPMVFLVYQWSYFLGFLPSIETARSERDRKLLQKYYFLWNLFVSLVVFVSPLSAYFGVLAAKYMSFILPFLSVIILNGFVIGYAVHDKRQLVRILEDASTS